MLGTQHSPLLHKLFFGTVAKPPHLLFMSHYEVDVI